MFVFELWKEMYTSGLEIAARSAFPSLPSTASSTNGYHGVKDTQFHSSAEDTLTALGELTFCTLTKKGEALTLGPNWHALTGLSHEQCMGLHFVDFFHPQHRLLFFRKVSELFDAPEEIQRFRVQYGSTHTGYHWFEIALAQRHCDQSGATYIAAVLRNIRREMESERALRTAQIESELALRARAEFLGHMSHELRTPLNAILGFCEMMEMGVHGEVENPHYREYLTSIRESGHMLLGRINDMLEVASIEVGNTEIHDTQLSPRDIAEAALQLHRHEAFCRQVTLKLAPAWPATFVRCDQAKITRALGNIVANAIRFSKHKGTVEIAAQITAENDIAFIITDKGEGISADHLEQLQDALERKASMFSSSAERVCLGLGLVVAKEFVCLHGGALAIDSAKGKGTEVTLTLPRERITSLETPRMRRKRQAIGAAI